MVKGYEYQGANMPEYVFDYIRTPTLEQIERKFVQDTTQQNPTVMQRHFELFKGNLRLLYIYAHRTDILRT